MVGADGGEVDQETDRWREQEQRFNREAAHAVHRRFLPHQSVKAERDRQRHSQPREIALPHERDRHAECHQRQRRIVSGPQLLFEEQRRERRVDQRHHVVAETGFGHALGDGRVNVEQPVDREEYRREEQNEYELSRREDAEDFAQPGREDDEDRDDRQRPRDPVRENFPRRHFGVFQFREVQRHQPPPNVRHQAERQAGSELCRIGHHEPP
jgi:hypothetical protein